MLLVLLVAVCANAQKPLGIDVSHWQGTGVNWTSVKNSGRMYAWVKATEGTGYTDDTFTVNEANAKAAGVLIGAYHFARPDQNLGLAGADLESSHFWSVAQNYVKGTNTYLMPVLDLEQAPGASYTKTTLSQWANRWCSNIVAAAAANGVLVKPVIYTGVSYAGTWLNSTVTNWPNWIANYNGQAAQTGAPSGTTPWATWNIWQYSSTNSVPGVSGNCDVDVFNGTTNGFNTIFVIGGANAPYILSQPSSRYGDRAGSLSMRVSAGGAATLKYQWRFNAVNIAAATTSTLTLTNLQATNAGSYTVVITNTYGSITSSIATLTMNRLYTPVFSDNFDTNSSASWTNRSTTDTRAIFAYDYSGIGIAAAPNSGGITKGLRMEANLTTGATNALNFSPIGKSFTGDYRLHFDMWINANGPFPGGGTGSTEMVSAGVGTAGDRVQWNSAGATADGVWFTVDGEGQVGDTATTQGDFVAYIGTNQQAAASGVYASGTAATSRASANAYYGNVFPGGQTAPTGQTNYSQQTGSLDPGTVGFVWRDVVISKTNNTVEWFIDGLKIASVSGASITASNIFVGYWDPFKSISDNTNLSFGLIDNLRVEVPAVAPGITTQPQSLTVNQGSNATFSVVATGTPAPSYQWRFNGTNIVNATASSFTKTNAQPSDAGNYSVVLTNIAGSLTSSTVTLTVNVPPILTVQPTNRVVNAGGNTSFSVTAGGTAPYAYQWRFNATNILNATGSNYSMTDVQPAQAGLYSVLVSNVAGTTVSSNALLTVTEMQFPPAAITVVDGLLQFNISGAPGPDYFLEASTNLVDWVPVATLTNNNGTLQFSDPLTTNSAERFYRVSAPR